MADPSHIHPHDAPHAAGSDASVQSDAAPLASAVRTVSGLTLISRFMGLGRDLINARLLGDSAVGSAFMAAWAIPNLFRRLFGEGALAAAFIPEYAQLAKNDPETADRFAALTIALLTLVTAGLLIAGELICVLVLLLSADAPADRLLSLRLVMVMLPFMPLVCISAILGGMLQTHHRFGPTAAAPIVLNALIIAVALPFYLVAPDHRVAAAFWIGVAAVLAGVLQVGWSLLALRGKVRWKRGVASAREPMVRLGRRFVPVVIGMGTIQINAFLDTLIAMWPLWVGPTLLGYAYPLDDHANAILSFTQRLYQFPLGVFGIAVATAVFPLLARNADEPDRFLATLARGLRLSFFIGLPATVGLILIRHELTFVMYSGGRSAFSSTGSSRAAFVLLGYAPGIWAYSLNHVLTRAFYASGDMRSPMRVGILMVLVNLALNLTLIWFWKEAGLAISTSVSACLQLVILSIVLRRHLHQHAGKHGITHPGRLLDQQTVGALGKTILSTLGMTIVLLVIHGMWLGTFSQSAPWAVVFERLMILVCSGAISYLAFSYLLGQQELYGLFHRSNAADERPT